MEARQSNATSAGQAGMDPMDESIGNARRKQIRKRAARGFGGKCKGGNHGHNRISHSRSVLDLDCRMGHGLCFI